MAKYVVEWKVRDGLGGDESQPRRLLDVFSKWTPAAGNISQMLARVDNQGGLSIVETDNPLELLRDVSKFEVWLEFTVIPVVDMADAVPAFNEAVEFVDSVPR